MCIGIENTRPNIVSVSQNLVENVDNLASETEQADVRLHNTFNEFLMLSDSQFIESVSSMLHWDTTIFCYSELSLGCSLIVIAIPVDTTPHNYVQYQRVYEDDDGSDAEEETKTVEVMKRLFCCISYCYAAAVNLMHCPVL